MQKLAATPTATPTIDRSGTTLDRATFAGRPGAGRPGWLIELPDRIVMITCVLFIVAALLGAFRVMFWWDFVLVGALAVFGIWRFLPQTVARDAVHRNGTLIVLALVLVWFFVNAPFASEYMVAIRDPGIYMLTGAEISHTGGTPIDIRAAHALASSIPGLTDRLGAFGSANNVDIRLQGSTGVPAIIAIGYWIAGVNGAVLVNLVVGAVGLLAVYGLARRFLGGYWSLIPVGLLACAMPYIYLSRTTYTEVMATLLILASATWILSALETGRIADYILAGGFAGAAGLTRVDGALAFAGALFGLVLVMIGVGRSGSTVNLRWRVLAFAAAGWLMIGLGIVDLRYNNFRYLGDLASQSRDLWLGTAALTFVLVVLAFTKLGRIGFEYTVAAPRLALITTIALGAIFLFWFSRPWWMVNHNITSTPYQNAVAGLQAQDGLPIDGTRSYDEYSLWWFGWYFGWPFLALAAAGTCLWLYWAIARRKAAQLVLIATAGLVSVLYLDAINITPDQIWAFRRVLPVITPTLVIAAGLALRWLWKRKARWSRVLAIVAFACCLVGVALPWGRIFFAVEGSGQAAEIEQICGAAGDPSVIAMVNQDAPANYALTLRTVCNAQVVVINDSATFDWSKLAAAEKGRVAVVSFSSGTVPWVHEPAHPTTTTVVKMWSRHLLQTPRTTSIEVRSVYVGSLKLSGRVAFAEGSP